MILIEIWHLRTVTLNEMIRETCSRADGKHASISASNKKFCFFAVMRILFLV